ncbi:uncharacterized protein TNCV_4672561 [Trichonephila clavipes]|nr:uncharacterized protein TNCV_4672561 [Trichonephila clavipes]
MGAAIPNVLQPVAFVWFEKPQGPLMKVQPVPGWRPMKQLAVYMHFLRCGSLLDDWSIEGILNMVFVQMKSLRCTGSNTSSQHNQSDLIDQLLALANHPAAIMPMIPSISNCDSCSYCLQKRRNVMSTSALSL